MYCNVKPEWFFGLKLMIPKRNAYFSWSELSRSFGIFIFQDADDDRRLRFSFSLDTLSMCVCTSVCM